MYPNERRNMYLIYKVTNLRNGKIYIGMTGHSFQHRWNQHLADVRNHCNDYVFHKALKKYGIEEFKTEIVSTGLTKTEAQQREIELIRECNSYYLGGWGYNMTYGGQCNDHKKGELNYAAKLTNKKSAKVRELLKDYSLTYFDIIKQIGLEVSEKNRSLVARINCGISYRDENEKYPIRKDGRTVEGSRRRGVNNPNAKLVPEQVLKIVQDLENSSETQTALGKKYGVTYNTINLINRCKIWNDLHSYNYNIRKEFRQKGKK